MNPRIVRIFCVIGLAFTLAAQQPKNQKKGFNANDVYQMNGIDSINAFNGNLVLTIPLGISYPVGGGLSYQLTLISNANIWEAEEVCRTDPNSTATPPPCLTVCPFNLPCDAEQRGLPILMHPHRRANAGIGWQVTMGRLYHPEHPAMHETSQWTYESPDGADHPFTSGDVSGVSTTTDGSYLRMRNNQPETGKRTIDFPNGEWKVFGLNGEGNWAIEKMGNQYPGNEILFDWPGVVTYDNKTFERWVISDSHNREQWIDFEYAITDGESRQHVANIWLETFGSQPRARYRFIYESRTLNRGAHHTDDAVTSQTVAVRVLKAIVLPDGTEYALDYENGSATTQTGGLPTEIVVPTQGKISWTWGTYQKPSSSAASGEQYLAESIGVFTRTLYGRTDPMTPVRPVIGVWNYLPGNSCEPLYQTVQNQCTLHTFFVNKITDPTGTVAENYFSVAPTVGVWTDLEYGQPFAKHLPDETGTRYLSTRVLRPPVAPETQLVPLRSTYLQMDHTNGSNFRSKSSRVVYENDKIANVPTYMDTDSSDWDGYGHYRTVKTSGTIPGTLPRTTKTEYFGPPTDRWITGLFTERTIEQGGKKTASRYCYDEQGTQSIPATWALTRVRTLAQTELGAGTPGLSTKDIVIDLTYDEDDGNVVEETYRGGDADPVGLQQCGALTGTVTYHVAHTYSYGSLATTKYLDENGDFDYLTEDNVIDQATGLAATTRDTSGVPTDFDYDEMGRIALVDPQGRATTEYAYPPDTSGWFQIEAVQTASNGSATYKKYDIDSFGRVIGEWTSLPGAQESRQETQYDALGRRISESEPGTGPSLPKTLFTYDALGKLIKVKRPDNSETTFVHYGDRVTERTQKLATPFSAAQSVTTTEHYDGYGQLLRVQESSGPTTAATPVGATVTTDYTYTSGGALRTVRMQSGNDVQERAFDYDGRGFMTWESHPENGEASYTYDSRGNMLSKTFGSGSPHDLQFDYDEVGHLVLVDGRNGITFQTLKIFSYATANSGGNLRRGKLTWAARFNYPNTPLDFVYVINHQYDYTDPAGRLTGRTTTIEKDDQVVRTFTTSMVLDERDQPVTINYPVCTNCGMPSADADRSGIVRVYDRGRVVSMYNPSETNPIISSVSFWPNGMRNVLAHGNGISDIQDVATPTTMRPSRLRFGIYDRCVAPTIADVGQPDNQSGTPALLDVSATGTGPLRYEWFDETSGIVVGGNTSSVSVTPSVTSRYHVTVVGACGIVRSNTVEVAVSGCTAPTIASISSVRQVDGSYVLSADVAARSGRTFLWQTLPGLAQAGTQAELVVPAPSSSVQYRLTVTDTCGSASRDVQINIAAALESSAYAVSAQVQSGKIQVTWPAVPNASSYVLERRAGGEWLQIASQSALLFLDFDVVPNRTYAYRVYAIASGATTGSNYMTSAVATTRVFAQASSGASITPAPSNDMLAAVNSVRAAAGWPALTWSNVLAPNQPLPAAGNFVLASHVAACRARMNEALQALGVSVGFYSPVSLEGQPISKDHINMVQQRAQGGTL